MEAEELARSLATIDDQPPYHPWEVILSGEIVVVSEDGEWEKQGYLIARYTGRGAGSILNDRYDFIGRFIKEYRIQQRQSSIFTSIKVLTDGAGGYDSIGALRFFEVFSI